MCLPSIIILSLSLPCQCVISYSISYSVSCTLVPQLFQFSRSSSGWRRDRREREKKKGKGRWRAMLGKFNGIAGGVSVKEVGRRWILKLGLMLYERKDTTEITLRARIVFRKMIEIVHLK